VRYHSPTGPVLWPQRNKLDFKLSARSKVTKLLFLSIFFDNLVGPKLMSSDTYFNKTTVLTFNTSFFTFWKTKNVSILAQLLT